MLTERAIAIRSTCQKRRRLQTRGSKRPSGKKSATLPTTFCLQNDRAFEPLGKLAEKQVSVPRLGWSSIPV